MVPLAKMLMRIGMLKIKVFALSALFILQAERTQAECSVEKMHFYSPQRQERAAYTFEKADTDALRAKGLMYRRFLPDNHGMLFIWDNVDIRTMWMKHTYIPLDMIYMREGYVVGIVHKAMPHTEVIRGGELPAADSILEVIGEDAFKHNIQVGDSAIIRSEPVACE